jgi:hypothetical protein
MALKNLSRQKDKLQYAPPSEQPGYGSKIAGIEQQITTLEKEGLDIEARIITEY